MTHITLNGTFKTAQEAIEDVKKTQLGLFKKIGNHKPVIVATQFSARKISYGIQFWSDRTIREGESINTDNTISKYCYH